MLSLLGALLVAVGVVACTNDNSAKPAVTVPSTIDPLAKEAEKAAPVSTMPFPPGFVPIDSRGVELPHLVAPDVEQPPIPVFGGNGHISGVVLGPDGPVEGATVRLERFVGNRGGIADVTTTRDGRFDAWKVYGGHYRVRAFLRPDLTTTEPQVGFVPDVDTAADPAGVSLTIAVERHNADRLQAALDVGDPKLGQPVTLLALLDKEDVDQNGLVQGKPTPDVEISLSLGDGVRVIGPDRATTGADGFARFTIECTSTGAHDATVSGLNLSKTVTLPECLPADATTTTAGAQVDDGGSSTSSTTVVLPVGGRFTTPRDEEIPAGTYVALSNGGACRTEYELYVFSGWRKTVTNGGTIQVPYPARNLKPVAGSPSCTFGRIA